MPVKLVRQPLHSLNLLTGSRNRHTHTNDPSPLAIPDGLLSDSVPNGDIGSTSGVWYESTASRQLDTSVSDMREPPVDLPPIHPLPTRMVDACGHPIESEVNK